MKDVDCSSIRTVRVHKEQFDAIEKKADSVIITCIEDGRCVVFGKDTNNPWHPCSYNDDKLEHDGTWKDGKWYKWLDKYGNQEIARMKLDAYDHFYPQTAVIKEEDVIAFREIKPNESED